MNYETHIKIKFYFQIHWTIFFLILLGMRCADFRFSVLCEYYGVGQVTTFLLFS